MAGLGPIVALAMARTETHQLLRILKDQADKTGWGWNSLLSGCGLWSMGRVGLDLHIYFSKDFLYSFT